MVKFANDILIPSLVAGALYGLVATGFNVLERTTGVLNFAHGNLITWAPLATVFFVQRFAVTAVVAFFLAVLSVVVLALVEERIAIRPFVQSGRALPWILSTLGFGVILTQLSVLPFAGVAQAFPWHLGYAPLDVGGFQFPPVGLTVISAAVLVGSAISAFYRMTGVGRQLEAVAEDIDGARAIGIHVRRMSQLAAVIAAIVAVITGWVVAPILQVFPELGLLLTFNGFVAAAIGGIGSIEGGLVGGLAVGVLIQTATVYGGSVWVNPALFGALLVVYLVRPTGLLGRRAERLV